MILEQTARHSPLCTIQKLIQERYSNAKAIFWARSVSQNRGTSASIAREENPAQVRRAGKEELTLGELFESYIKLHAQKHKPSWEADIKQFDRHLFSWKKRKLSSIRKIDLHKLHARDYILLSLLTGARKSNVLAMR
jgi:hypothetical protein